MNSDNSGNSESSGNARGAITEKAYREDVKRVYEARKNVLYEGKLIDPKRSGLRNIFKRLEADRLNRADVNVLTSFLQTSNLDNVDLDRFRPLIKFMKGQTQVPDVEVVNLLAILIDYKSRPLNVFNLNGPSDETIGIELPEPERETFSEGDNTSGETFGISPETKKNNFVFWLFGVLVLGCIGTYLLYNQQECMQWNGSEYIRTACDEAVKRDNRVYGFNAEQFLVKRVAVRDTTTFFRNGEPQFWYIRNDGYEFYNHPGHHPVETTRELLPVSTYIAKKIQKREIRP